jgi:ATP-dependent 26S proteasome regulatory subunit
MSSAILYQRPTKGLQEDGGGYQGRAISWSDYWGSHEAARRRTLCVYTISTSISTHYPLLPVIVKASSGPRYVVSYRPALPAHKLKAGTRVSLDMTTLTIMRILPREVDPMVYKMSLEDPGSASFAGIGGLSEQVRELREVRPR